MLPSLFIPPAQRQRCERSNRSCKKTGIKLRMAGYIADQACHDGAFRLDVVEAMESGTQVIVMNRGSMPELILDEETKFLVNSVDELQRVVSISAKNVGNV
jgi:glycosyltransferase involved in cell wall biosynthesis